MKKNFTDSFHKSFFKLRSQWVKWEKCEVDLFKNYSFLLVFMYHYIIDYEDEFD